MPLLEFYKILRVLDKCKHLTEKWMITQGDGSIFFFTLKRELFLSFNVFMSFIVNVPCSSKARLIMIQTLNSKGKSFGDHVL